MSIFIIADWVRTETHTILRVVQVKKMSPGSIFEDPLFEKEKSCPLRTAPIWNSSAL